MIDLLPNIPIEIETRKNVFMSPNSSGGRQTTVKSDAVRFYTLNFQFRDQAEYLATLNDWDTYYPDTAFEWTSAPINASGFFYFDSEVKVTAINPNTFDYSISVRARDGLTPSNPGTTTFPYKPNFAYEITNNKKVVISDSIGFARHAKSTSDMFRQFQYTFRNRSLTETLAAENFWAYHYPQTQVSFVDDTFDDTYTFWLDSNFKWTVNSIELIDYTFVFTEAI